MSLSDILHDPRLTLIPYPSECYSISYYYTTRAVVSKDSSVLYDANKVSLIITAIVLVSAYNYYSSPLLKAGHLKKLYGTQCDLIYPKKSLKVY